MQSAARAVFACLALTTGCAGPSLPPPCSPGELPPIGEHELESPASFEAARDDVERSSAWLLCVVPSGQQPDAWVARRNLVMDWIEQHPTLDYRFSAAVVEPVHKDRRFKLSMYMNMAYAIGKARYLLATATPDPVAAEVAGINAMVQYYASLAAAEPKLESRKLERFVRWQHKGKLEPWVAKKLAGR